MTRQARGSYYVNLGKWPPTLPPIARPVPAQRPPKPNIPPSIALNIGSSNQHLLFKSSILSSTFALRHTEQRQATILAPPAGLLFIVLSVFDLSARLRPVLTVPSASSCSLGVSDRFGSCLLFTTTATHVSRPSQAIARNIHKVFRDCTHHVQHRFPRSSDRHCQEGHRP